MNVTAFIGLLGGLMVLAYAANRLFTWTRVPDVLVLMVVGLLLGPVFGWINGSQLEPVTHAFGTLALILILFEAGLDLDFRDTLRHLGSAFLVSLLAFALTLASATLVVRQVLGMDTRQALLVGAVFGCTSSSVAIPILQQLELRKPARITMLLDYSLSDVFAVLTVEALLDLGTPGGAVAQVFLWEFVFRLTVAILLASFFAYLWSELLPLLSEQRYWHALTFAAVMLLYAFAEGLHSNGLIAVVVFGLVLANLRRRAGRLLGVAMEAEVGESPAHTQMRTFHGELAFLVRSFFFVLIGVVVQLAGLLRYAALVSGIVGAILVSRWLAVRCARWTFDDFDAREQEMPFWLMPRGLINVVLALEVLDATGPAFSFLPEVVFAVILATNLVVIIGSIRARRPRQMRLAPLAAATQPAPPAES